MDKIQFKLDAFEGPLDLLLHLISKHKLNIFDIEISVLLEQYLMYMDKLDFTDFEYAGEFLEMAAKLIYIKTASLLPKPNDADDAKKELQDALAEYYNCKKLAEFLKSRYLGNDISVRLPLQFDEPMPYSHSHDAGELLNAYHSISAASTQSNSEKAHDNISRILNQKFISVTSKVIFILRKLYLSGSVNMDELYQNSNDRSSNVAVFLAILELAKSGRIHINEDNSEITFIGKSKFKNIHN